MPGSVHVAILKSGGQKGYARGHTLSARKTVPHSRPGMCKSQMVREEMGNTQRGQGVGGGETGQEK